MSSTVERTRSLKRGGRGRLMQFHVTEIERIQIQRDAIREGLPVAQYIRRLLGIAN